MASEVTLNVLAAQIVPIVVTLGVMTLKVLALVLGYKVVKLGYEALIKGVGGTFDFGGKVKTDFELKLVSTSPGLLFVLLGVVLMGWALVPHAKMETPEVRVEHRPRDPPPIEAPEFE